MLCWKTLNDITSIATFSIVVVGTPLRSPGLKRLLTKVFCVLGPSPEEMGTRWCSAAARSWDSWCCHGRSRIGVPSAASRRGPAMGRSLPGWVASEAEDLGGVRGVRGAGYSGTMTSGWMRPACGAAGKFCQPETEDFVKAKSEHFTGSHDPSALRPRGNPPTCICSWASVLWRC